MNKLENNKKTELFSFIDQLSIPYRQKKVIQLLIDQESSYSSTSKEWIQRLRELPSKIQQKLHFSLPFSLTTKFSEFVHSTSGSFPFQGALPPELIHKIFSSLNAKDLVHILKTCKGWNQFLSFPNTYKEILSHKTSFTFDEIQDYKIFIEKRYGVKLSTVDLLKLCPHLTELDLSYTGSDPSTSSITEVELASIFKECSFPHLSILRLRNCTRLNTLPDFPAYISHLTVFDCSGCTYLKSLPDFNMPELIELDCSRCGLQTLPDFHFLQQLKRLNCSECPIILLPEFSHLTSLEELNCSQCPGLSKLPDFQLHQLITLNCSNCVFREIPDFHDLPLLQNLNCYNCFRLTKIPDFQFLPHLLELDCRRCSPALKIPKLGYCPLVTVLKDSKGIFN